MLPSSCWCTPDDVDKLVQFFHSEHTRWINGKIIDSEADSDDETDIILVPRLEFYQ